MLSVDNNLASIHADLKILVTSQNTEAGYSVSQSEKRLAFTSFSIAE